MQKLNEFWETVIKLLNQWRITFSTIVARLAFKIQYYSKKSLFHFRLRLPHFKKAHINTFPAVHFKKFDKLDYLFKFSSEILVFVMTITVAAMNLYFLHPDFNDKSYAAQFLDYHNDLNKKLYAKQASIKTTVISSSGFIAAAYADNSSLTSNGVTDESSTEEAHTLITHDSLLVAASPDSISSLIAKQIKIYETQPGDTLKSIAAANGISQQTIIWANQLPNNTVKPGWQLIILPTDGVLVKANSNTTLPDLANRYNPERYNNNKKVRDESAAQLLDKIISYNSLANAEDIDDGDYIIIPGGAVVSEPAPVVPKPTPKPRTSSSGKVGTNTTVEDITPDISISDDTHIFPKGYCTWYVAQKVRVPWGGNAKNWPKNAKAYGAVVTNVPAKGAIVVTNDSARYGHVAYVEKVEDDAIVVSEMNYVGFGKVDTRRIPINSSSIKAYIYP